MDNRLIFIIAHKYYRGYVSYVNFYIDNIKSLYPNSLIIIVDNNSPNKGDVFNSLKYDDIILLDNNIECKFEIGAYQVGINYLLENNLINDYDYVIFSQDTYILKNKYDFNIFKTQNIHAASFVGLKNDFEKWDVCSRVLRELNLTDKLEYTTLCWCNSFIVSTEKIQILQTYFKPIVIKVRYESEASERYLGRIILELNGGQDFSLQGDNNLFLVDGKTYNCLEVNPYWEMDNYFCKVAQQKNENTNEKY